MTDHPSFNNDLGNGTQAPWVGAHVASISHFCNRYALIEHERGQADEGEDERPTTQSSTTRLDWLPDYDEELINQALQRRWNQVWWALKYVLWWLILSTVVFALYAQLLGIFLAAPLLVITPLFWHQGQKIFVLECRRRAAAQVTDKLNLSDLGQKEQVVSWWALRKAFASVRKPREALSDPELRLSGKPFLILQSGSLRIPVVRKHRGKHELRDQNRARVAAYCHLIETVERGQAPFGVFMFADSYDVYIVPNSQAAQSLFRRGLEQTRKVLERVKAGDLPQPAPASHCLNCPLGKPRVHRPGVTDQHLSILPGSYTPQLGADGREYHSVCGDRFEWLPPHARAEEKKLGKAS
jgi:hypothetical protein